MTNISLTIWTWYLYFLLWIVIINLICVIRIELAKFLCFFFFFPFCEILLSVFHEISPFHLLSIFFEVDLFVIYYLLNVYEISGDDFHF